MQSVPWLQTGRPGFDPRQSQIIFPLASVSRPALRTTQPPIQWVPGVLSPGGKARPARDAHDSPPSSAEVKKLVGAICPLSIGTCMALAGQRFF
jgi:hypothetical protein